MSDPENTAPEKLTQIIKLTMAVAWLVIIALIVYGLVSDKPKPYDPSVSLTDQAQPYEAEVITAEPGVDTNQEKKKPTPGVEGFSEEIRADVVATPPAKIARAKLKPPHKKAKRKKVEKKNVASFFRKKATGRKIPVATSPRYSAPSKRWLVRFAVCRQKESCETLRRKLFSRGIKTFILYEVGRFPGGASRAYKVYYDTTFSTKDAARGKLIEFKNDGIDCAIEQRNG